MPDSRPLPTFERLAEELIASSQAAQRDVQAAFASAFFEQLLALNLGPEKSYEAWQKIVERGRQLATEQASRNPFRDAALDVLRHSTELRDPIVTEFGELQRLRLGSATDHLTGVSNRRLFDAAVTKEVSRSVRYGRDLTLVLLDLNRFKDVNDTHGHPVGDELLVLTARLMNEAARSADSIFRLGGDEFGLLLPDTAQPGAEALAERIRRRFAESIEPMGLRVPVSVAYGLATSPREARDPETLFAVADQRLYQFKRSIGSPRTAPRRHIRVPLDESSGWLVAGFDANRSRLPVLDFSFGGLSARVTDGIKFPEAFEGDLYLPVLPAARVRLKTVYYRPEDERSHRLGCAFLTNGHR
jgi:diguanylate cyclase (GGDEF)-like protein